METLTIDQLKEKGLIIFEVISGSRAYGLETVHSDTDIRGVFVMPQNDYYGLSYTAQVNNETNDIVYYELKRFMELLSKNNPTILELLHTPASCILYKHPVMEYLDGTSFLSKLCQQSFANYAFSQIQKAYSLEKKIVQPMDEVRKSVTDFCYVYQEGKAAALIEYFATHHLKMEAAGLTAIPHLKDCYNLFYSEALMYGGVVSKEEANAVCLRSIPKGEQPIAMLYFNKDGYSVYCKQYKEYWDWVAKRNETRYAATLSHGKKYDAKNMMHVFRLLKVAKEIAVEGKLNVFRKDRDELLSIKAGEHNYEDLVEAASSMHAQLTEFYANSNLPQQPDVEMVNELLIKMRKTFYATKQ